MARLLDRIDDTLDVSLGDAPGPVDWGREWCEQCATSDDPIDAGTPVSILYTDLDIDDNDEYVGITELSCGHMIVHKKGLYSIDYDWGHGDPEYNAVHAEESIICDIAELIASAMNKRSALQAELAERCGTTPTRMIRQLNDRTDMTVRELVTMCHQLGYELRPVPRDRKIGEWLSLD